MRKSLVLVAVFSLLGFCGMPQGDFSNQELRNKPLTYRDRFQCIASVGGVAALGTMAGAGMAFSASAGNPMVIGMRIVLGGVSGGLWGYGNSPGCSKVHI
ncbi:MAG: hypothetical protein OXT67_09145 [Zetaproteobacteria bacterium]|nr:hypothetical protein [Zetaproteobacteria bacterium]